MGNQAFSSEPTAGNADDDTSTSEIVASEVSGSHVLTINGYSWTKRVSCGQYITSSSFTAAGHRWHLRYYPNGYSPYEYASGHISIFLTCDTEVDARCTFSLLDKDGKPTHSCSIGNNNRYVRMANNSNGHGILKFITRKELEELGYLRDDRFRIRCDISAMKLVFQREEAAGAVTKFVDVPPSDILEHLSYLLWSADGTDVMFEVDGESFRAHRSILAARSKVFKAELFSPMKEGTTSCVWVEDMEPRVFKALLHFVYNDVLPLIDEGEMMVMAQRLLVAADRYCLERLKLICEEKLCGYIDTSSVGTMLELARKHGCPGLKKACLSFLMSGSNLMEAVLTGGLEHVMNNCPSVVKDLLLKSCS